MKKLINTFEAQSCPLVWLQATQFLRAQPEHRAYNLVLGVEAPDQLSPSDFAVYDLADEFLRRHECDPLNTVAGTIFPANHYLENGAEGVFTDYADEYPGFRTSWGTYAYRMIRKPAKPGESAMVINPLEILVEKMKSQQKKGHFKAVYELNLVEADDMLEIPTYDGALDCNRILPHPCLSHLSFKVLPQDRVMLTAIYRSHYYMLKALGNLLGLAQLLLFVARETGLHVGPLVCHSTSAVLDMDNWRMNEVDQVLAECEAVYIKAGPQTVDVG